VSLDALLRGVRPVPPEGDATVLPVVGRDEKTTAPASPESPAPDAPSGRLSPPDGAAAVH